MKQTALTFGVLAFVWLALSGQYGSLFLALGAASCVLVIVMASRLGLERQNGLFLQTHTIGFVSYVGWLLVEIVKANLDVARRILSRGPDIECGVLHQGWL